jgi:hypothetical protein
MKKKNADRTPHVGIFWLVNGKLVIDSTPLSEAEPYGDSLTHPRSHNDVWEQYQRIGKVPSDVGYDEPPRGRAMFDRTTETFTILADKCILSRKDLLAQITDALHLPAKTKIDTDPHYECFKCLYGSDVDEDED